MTKSPSHDALSLFSTSLAEIPQGASYLFVFHLQTNNLPYLKAWCRGRDVIGIISIPYSEKASVKASLEAVAKIYSVASTDEIPPLIQKVCEENIGKRIVIIEVGGYSASVADQLPSVVLAVEDTAAGHQRFLTYEDKLRFPVISIAYTEGKRIESRAVGRSIAQGVCSTFEKLQEYVGLKRNASLLVLGYGSVGSAVAAAVRKSVTDKVSIYDTKEEARQSASRHGFYVGERMEAIGTADVIIGCTGRLSLSFEDMKFLQEGCLLISGSSRQVELPIKELATYRERQFSDSLLSRYEIERKKFYIAYEGQPVNFYFDSDLGDAFQVPMALLARSVSFGFTHALSKKVYTLPFDQERNVMKQYLQSHDEVEHS